eukprot:230001-Pelagomonas_calceolata.AAC.1
MSMKLQSKLGGFMIVKAKLFKRLQSVREIAVLLLKGLELTLGPSASAAFDLHKTDVLLSWEELTRVMDLASRWSGSGWR